MLSDTKKLYELIESDADFASFSSFYESLSAKEFWDLESHCLCNLAYICTHLGASLQTLDRALFSALDHIEQNLKLCNPPKIDWTNLVIKADGAVFDDDQNILAEAKHHRNSCTTELHMSLMIMKKFLEQRNTGVSAETAHLLCFEDQDFLGKVQDRLDEKFDRIGEAELHTPAPLIEIVNSQQGLANSIDRIIDLIQGTDPNEGVLMIAVPIDYYSCAFLSLRSLYNKGIISLNPEYDKVYEKRGFSFILAANSSFPDSILVRFTSGKQKLFKRLSESNKKILNLSSVSFA